jgi:hypothetical protein
MFAIMDIHVDTEIKKFKQIHLAVLIGNSRPNCVIDRATFVLDKIQTLMDEFDVPL